MRDSICRHIFLDELDSTNEYIKRHMADLESYTIVQTSYQTNGKGQRGRQWNSERGKNLLVSLFLKPNWPVEQQFYISKVTALALVDTILHFIHPQGNIAIKWPNDIYVKDKKIAGILIENTIRDIRITETIIGVGLNVNQEKFADDLPNPLSIKQIVGKEIDLNEVLRTWCEIFKEWWQKMEWRQFDVIDKAYARRLYFGGKKVLINDGIITFTATLSDVDESGALILRNGKNKYFYRFGEVEIEYYDL